MTESTSIVLDLTALEPSDELYEVIGTPVKVVINDGQSGTEATVFGTLAYLTFSEGNVAVGLDHAGSPIPITKDDVATGTTATLTYQNWEF